MTVLSCDGSSLWLISCSKGLDNFKGWIWSEVHMKVKPYFMGETENVNYVANANNGRPGKAMFLIPRNK
jgi:hypothetical protein